MTQTNDRAPVERAVVSRRAVLRTGAHAAWAVPLVQVAAANPAAASSVGATPALLLTPGAGAWGGSGNSRTVTLPVTIKNTGAAPTQNLQVTYSPATGTTFNPTSVSGTNGWTVTSSGNTWTFTAQAQLVAGGSATLTPVFVASDSSNREITVNVVATCAPGSISASTQVTAPRRAGNN